MLKEECRLFQKVWLGWTESQMDQFVRIGTQLAQALAEGRKVYAFGIGEDHWFAEELTARLQGQDVYKRQVYMCSSGGRKWHGQADFRGAGDSGSRS